MSRREDMERILSSESERWSSMSVEQLVAELREELNYEVTARSQVYQFEVQLFENTETYVHVSIAVDDGRLLYSIKPLCESFIKQKS